MTIILGISNRHIHLTKEDLNKLFGSMVLDIKKELVQPGQYATSLTVTIKTEKSSISSVRVLGPTRNYTQVELSKTDAYKLGINPPIRDSGDLTNASMIEIIGPKASIKKECAIIANRHIHMTPLDQKNLGLEGKEEVQVKFQGIKGAILDHVKLKVSNDYKLELHLDTDDANALLLHNGDEGEIIS